MKVIRRQRSVVLIGMPGAGKSTVGILLAKELGLSFLDTDVEIQVQYQQSLQDILENRGYLALREIEEQVILGLRIDSTVIATGGSAVYGERAMDHLKDHAIVVFIDVPLPILSSRINNYDSRGIARQSGMSFQDLFEERSRLYKKCADIQVQGEFLVPADIVAQVIQMLSSSEGYSK